MLTWLRSAHSAASCIPTYRLSLSRYRSIVSSTIPCRRAHAGGTAGYVHWRCRLYDEESCVPLQTTLCDSSHDCFMSLPHEWEMHRHRRRDEEVHISYQTERCTGIGAAESAAAAQLPIKP